MSWVIGLGSHAPRPVAAALALVATLAVGATGCGGGENGGGGTDEAVAEPSAGVARIINVEVTPIELSSFVDVMGITGEVEAYREAILSAEEGGSIESFPVPKGRRVGEGQILAKLKDDVIASLVEEARASLLIAAERFERRRRVWEEDRIGSEIAYLEAKYEQESAQARLSNLEARLAHTEIRAPFAGVFDENYLELGEYAQPGAPVVRIVDAARLKVTAGVPERFARVVETGDDAEVTFDILPGVELTGEIAFVGRSVDEASRTFPIEVVMENPEGAVKPNMVANVRIIREEFEGAVVVSQDAVLRTETGYQAYVVRKKNGKSYAEVRDLELGPTAGNSVMVRSGLTEGERLVTVGQRLLDDQTLVRVVNGDDKSTQPASEERAAR